MAVDYDEPKTRDDDDSPVEELEAAAGSGAGDMLEEGDPVATEDFELPGADLSHEKLVVNVTPKQDDEFTCGSCFLVYHEGLLAYYSRDMPICADCSA